MNGGRGRGGQILKSAQNNTHISKPDLKDICVVCVCVSASLLDKLKIYLEPSHHNQPFSFTKSNLASAVYRNTRCLIFLARSIHISYEKLMMRKDYYEAFAHIKLSAVCFFLSFLMFREAADI